jgi:hypothetical protein
MSMEKTRKLGPIALITSIAAMIVAALIFSAQNISGGTFAPSTSRFATMRYSTQTAATNWHQLRTAYPKTSHTVACKKVSINPASSHTVLPSISHKEPLCVQLSIAGGGHYTWSSSSRTPYSALSLKTQQYLQGAGSQGMGLWFGLKLSPSGVLSGTMRFAQIGSYNYTVTATSGHKRIVADLKQDISGHGVLAGNWNGYGMEGGPFNGVSATFNTPHATSTPCHLGVRDGYCDEAVWVGVGNSHPKSIIQAGIAERILAGTRKVCFSDVWFELFPAPPVEVNLPFHQGDRVSVNIHKTVTPDLWSIQITNDTTGQTFSTLQFYTGSTSSAEWIVEAPGIPTLSLPELTPVTFTHSRYSLATNGTLTNRFNYWSFHRYTYTTASPITPSGSFTVSSSPM